MNAALTAGSTFAVTVLIGFLAGLALANKTGFPFWAIIGLFAGVFAGGALAAKALLKAGK